MTSLKVVERKGRQSIRRYLVAYLKNIGEEPMHLVGEKRQMLDDVPSVEIDTHRLSSVGRGVVSGIGSHAAAEVGLAFVQRTALSG